MICSPACIKADTVGVIGHKRELDEGERNESCNGVTDRCQLAVTLTSVAV